MKSLRLILALVVAGAFALTAARAGNEKAKEKSAEKAVCTMDCKQDKDGKFTCSKDGGKTCCCGAEAKTEKKSKTGKKSKDGKKKDGKEEHSH